VLPQPRHKLLRGHAVHTGRAPVSPDTPHRPAQILRREHLLPQAHPQARDDSIPGTRRPAATLSCGAHRNSPSPPGSWPASAGWLRSTRPARAPPIPPPHSTSGPFRPHPTPAGTTTSAGLCPVSPHLTVRAAGAATPQHTRHPGRFPRIRTTNVPLRPPRLRDDPVDGDGLCLLEQTHPDRPAFHAVRVSRCRVSPRASFPPRLMATQFASGPELAPPLPPGDFHPQSIAHAGRTQGRLRRRLRRLGSARSWIQATRSQEPAAIRARECQSSTPQNGKQAPSPKPMRSRGDAGKRTRPIRRRSTAFSCCSTSNSASLHTSRRPAPSGI
jgi:hypothetical protein